MHHPRTSAPHRQQTIGLILRKARARRDPNDIAGFEATLNTRQNSRRAPGLTQDEVARLVGASLRWYRELERGAPQNYSADFLHAIRRLLALTDREWETILRLTRQRHTGEESDVDLESLRAQVPKPLEHFVHVQRWPTYLCDRSWDVITYNKAAAQHFPWMAYGTANIMIWAMTYPEARTQLINWRTDWAMPMITQLRLHAEQWTDDPRIRQIIDKVCSDPTARALWDSPELPTPPLPDANTPRRLYLPRHGTQQFEVTLLKLTPLDIQSLHCMTLIPTTTKLNSQTTPSRPRMTGRQDH